MFKFGFSDETSAEETSKDKNHENPLLNWFPASEIHISDDQMSKEWSNEDEITTNNSFSGVNLKLIRQEKVTVHLKNEEHENIIKAETQHSDLLPAVYEGGLKIWECTHDLSNYLITNKVPLENKRILDLGCGAGVLGIIALIKGANVHFQDYNKEVIELVTIPNVLLNSADSKIVKTKTEFYSGDWAAFTELFSSKYPREEDKYDIILTSETIYNEENQPKLYDVFKKCLKLDGAGYIAAKTYYFGVGGGMRQFESLIAKDNQCVIEQVWKSDQGLQREIMKLTKRKS